MEGRVQRIVRNTAIAQQVKALYNHRCQICGTRVETVAGPYAEGAHIRPLGRPHDGPDVLSNILCLCPNDHVRFDGGSLHILDDWTVIDVVADRQIGRLKRSARHSIGAEHLQYHRQAFGPDSSQ